VVKLSKISLTTADQPVIKAAVVCQSYRQGEQGKTSRRTQRPQAGSCFEGGVAGAGNDKAGQLVEE
jgi:hypothetical protein